MAATSSAPLPPAWNRILEQIEAALSKSLSEIPEIAASAGPAALAPPLHEPELNSGWSIALTTADASAKASEAELARAEQMLRDWLGAVQTSRARLEAMAFPNIR